MERLPDFEPRLAKFRDRSYEVGAVDGWKVIKVTDRAGSVIFFDTGIRARSMKVPKSNPQNQQTSQKNNPFLVKIFSEMFPYL